MPMKAPIPYKDGVSVRQFLKFTFIYAKFTFEKYHQKLIPTYINSTI